MSMYLQFLITDSLVFDSLTFLKRLLCRAEPLSELPKQLLHGSNLLLQTVQLGGFVLQNLFTHAQLFVQLFNVLFVHIVVKWSATEIVGGQLFSKPWFDGDYLRAECLRNNNANKPALPMGASKLAPLGGHRLLTSQTPLGAETASKPTLPLGAETANKPTPPPPPCAETQY